MSERVAIIGMAQTAYEAEKKKQQESDTEAKDADEESKQTEALSSAQPIIIYRSPGAPGTPGSGVPPMPGLFPVSGSTSTSASELNNAQKKTKKTPRTKDDYIKTQGYGMYGTPGPTSPTGSPQYFPLLHGYQPSEPGAGTGAGANKSQSPYTGVKPMLPPKPKTY